MPDQAPHDHDLTVTVHDEDDGSVYHLSAAPETLVKVVVDDLYTNYLHRERREDDRPEVVTQRLAVYRDQTEPVLEYLGDQVPVVRVDGTASVEEVHRSLLRVLV